MTSPVFRTITAAFAGVAVLASGYAWHLHTQVNRRDGDLLVAKMTCDTSLAECTTAREVERGARAAFETNVNDALDASRAELAELRSQRVETEKRLAALKSLTDKFRKMIDSGKLQVVLHHGRMVVKLPAGILFASGSAELSKEGKDALREVAAVLRQVPDRRFMVAGHTDNVPVGQPSPFRNNLELSTARSLVVADHLITSGMPPARLVTAGYAEHEPVRDNRTEPGRHENRRIEIVLLPNVTELAEEHVDAGAKDAGDGGNERRH